MMLIKLSKLMVKDEKEEEEKSTQIKMSIGSNVD